MHRDFSTLAIIDKPYESCARAWRVTAARLIIDRNRQNTTSMPEIARFYGIIIRMFMEPLVQHNRPHFHAYYQGFVAVIGIDEVELVAGEIPKKQLRLTSHGRNFIKRNYWPIGTFCKVGNFR